MIHVINVKNPFDVREKVDNYVPCTGGPVSSYHIPAGGVYHYAINGIPVEPDTIPQDGDEIVIMPYVGKKLFSWILTIGLTFALGAITGGVGFAAGWSLGVRIFAGLAVSVIGGWLTNKLTPTPKIDLTNTEQSNTYGWNGAQTVAGQGYVLPTLYGRMKTGGIMLQRHVTSDGEKQYLNILYCLAEGVIDSIDTIKLNGNPIENYSGVVVDKRYGTNNQSIIKNFNDSYAETALAYELNTGADYSTTTLQGNTAEGLEITFAFPGGLYYSNDEGGMSGSWVDLVAEYRRVGQSGWTSFNVGRITKKTNTAFYAVYRVDNLTPGQYEVRARCTGKEGTSIRHVNKVQWISATQIIYDDFKHPGKALLGLKALATDQLSGNDPQMTCCIEKDNVWVWHPTEHQYVQKPANNPAWVAYDILHQCRDYEGVKVVHGASASRMDYYAFEAWAEACRNANITFNYLYDTAMRTWDAVCYPARVGRGSVFMVGTRVTCVFDFASNPVQLFTVANVKKGSFKEDFLEMAQRANAVEISFLNQQKEYERDVLTVYNDDYDAAEAISNPIQIELMGCVSVEQAYRFAKWKLKENRYEVRTITFDAFVDAIACKLGDVVLVQSDITMWGDGGRIEKVSGNVVTLDIPVDSDSTSIMVRDQSTDAIYTTGITAVNGNNVTVQSTQGMSKDAVFVVGKTGRQPKKVRVLSIEKSHNDETRTITAVEYYDELYSSDTGAIPQLQAYDASVAPPKALILSWEVFSSIKGNVRYLINCSWINPVIPNTIKLEVSKDNGPWIPIATLTAGTNQYSFDAVRDSVYAVRIYAENSIGRRSTAITNYINMTDAYQAAETPTNIKVFTRYRELGDGVNRYDLVVQWEREGLAAQVYYKTNHIQVKEMVIKKGQSVKEMGFANAWTYAGEGINQIVIPQAVVGDTYRIAICTADSADIYSKPNNATFVDFKVAPKSTTPNTPNNFVITFGDECIASWDEVSNADVEFYEVRTDTAVGKDIGLLTRTTSIKAALNLTSRSGRLYLFAKGHLYYSAPAILDYEKPAPLAPTNVTVAAKLGGFVVKCDPIPPDCNGVNFYIEGASLTSVHTVNNTFTHACDAGIYDIWCAYTDYFGEGASSGEVRAIIKATIDSSLLDDQAVTKAKLSSALQTSVDNAAQTALDLQTLAGTVSGQGTSISNNASAISSLAYDVGQNETNISILNQKANGIEATVQNLVVQGDVNQTAFANISANADAIAAIVGNLNNLNNAVTEYSALQMLSDGIASKVAIGDVSSWLQQSHTGFYIKGSLVDIDATTRIGNNIISGDMIQANAITAPKIHVDSLSAISAVIGTLRTATSGARLEIVNSNLIRVYDGNGTLRVRMGVW